LSRASCCAAPAIAGFYKKNGQPLADAVKALAIVVNDPLHNQALSDGIFTTPPEAFICIFKFVEKYILLKYER